MSMILPGRGLDITGSADGTIKNWTDTITITKVTAAGVKQIRITHDDIIAQVGGVNYTIPAATKIVNTADVATSTTYYCYYKLVNGAMTWVATTVHPDLESPEIEDYVWIRAIRFKSVSDTATIEFVQRQIMAHDEALHELGDYGYLMPPVYVSGFAPTISTSTGTISTEAGYYRRITGSLRSTTATTNGVIYEPAVDTARANLALITHYSGGESITATKYVKLLVGVLVNKSSDYNYIVNIQAKPSTEYTSAAEAWADADHKASTGFSATRRSAVLPLCWVVMKTTDASTIVIQDIRETGLAISMGGNVGVTSHAALSGLTNYADHPGYLLADGTRDLTGDMLVTAGKKIDGVDISAHAADAAAHHAAVSLAASADVLLGLSTQALSLDVQAAHKVLAGPTTGADAAPNFRIPAAADISDFDAAALAAAPAVSLAASAAVLMDITGQALSLDLQTASTVLAGPVIGGSAAAPTFRQLNIQDIARPSGTLTLTNGANHNVALTAGTRVYVVAGPTGAFNITGFTGGVDGSVLYIYNPTSNNMTLTNESVSSDAANRIVVGSATATNQIGAVTLFYIGGTVNRWIASSLIA